MIIDHDCNCEKCLVGLCKKRITALLYRCKVFLVHLQVNYVYSYTFQIIHIMLQSTKVANFTIRS